MTGALARQAPFGVYPGAFASRNPVCTLPTGTVVGSQDIAVGRFAWLDPATNEVSNAQVPGGQLGVVMPRSGTWELTYLAKGVRYLRAGKPCTMWTSGDFYLQFPQGALIGNPVFVDPSTGIAYGADRGGFVRTKWTATTNTAPGGLGIASPYLVLS